MKVGQRFDVVEVTIADHPANGSILPKGFQSVALTPEILTNAIEVYSTHNMRGCTFTLWTGDVKKIGTLIITKVK